MNIEQAWVYRFNQRYNWIKKAGDRYVDGFSNENLRQLRSISFKGTANVALYGKTQVGKTTFILNLLGIQEARIAELAEILRCGSMRGQSATPTAFIYRKSHDNDFHFRQEGQSERPIQEKDLHQLLIEIRKQVEANQCADLSEIYIDLPKYYFKNQDNVTDINIIDLPGVFSKNKHEKEHARLLIRKFLPVVTLVLIVERGNQIANLNDLFGDKLLNIICNWHFFPERFRLITTYSLTAESIGKRINATPNITVDDVRELYRTELKKSLGVLYPKKIKTYHLEFGDSWQTFLDQTYDISILSRYKDLLERQWQQLRKDIENNATELAQVLMSKRIPYAIHELRGKEQRIKEISLKKLDGGICRIKEQVDLNSNLIDKLRQEIRSLESEIKTIKDKLHFNYSIKHFSGLKINRDSMIRYIESVLIDIHKAVESLRKAKDECSIDININLSRIESHSEELFKNIHEKLNHKFFNKIWFTKNKKLDELEFAWQNVSNYLEKKRNTSLLVFFPIGMLLRALWKR